MAYHFQGNVPDRTISSSAFIMWMLIPQVVFLLASLSVMRVMMLGARYAPPGETPFYELLPLMGNMVALPQIVLFVIMLQIFIYNAYQTSIIPLWVAPLVILIAGGIILVVMFMRIIRRYRRKKTVPVNRTGTPGPNQERK